MPSFATAFLAMAAASGGFADDSPDTLRYTPNHGQWEEGVEFMARTRGLDMWVTAGGITYDFHRTRRSGDRFKSLLKLEKSEYHRTGHVVRLAFEGASGTSRTIGQGRLGGVSHYLRKDRSARFVPAFSAARVQGLYEGIDMVLYQDEQTDGPRYDLVLQPGANVGSIKIRYEGASRLRVTQKGEVAYDTSLGTVVEKGLFAYQLDADGTKRQVAARPRIVGGTVTYDVPRFDRSKTLVIDPLVYSTLIGGNDVDEMVRVDVDELGNRYLVGLSASQNYPKTVGAYDDWQQNGDAVVTKLTAAGSIDWSTFVGGADLEVFTDVAVDAQDRPVVCGYSTSTDFPVVNAIDPVGKGGPEGGAYDAVIARLAANGSSLLFSTYFASTGGDIAYTLGLDATGRIFFGGVTAGTDFPITSQAYQRRHSGGESDGFVASLTADGTSVRYSTFLGGDSVDYLVGLRVSDTGRAYVGGYTKSTNYPTRYAFQESLNEGGVVQDGMISVLDPTGKTLLFSTYHGGSGEDAILGIDLTPAESIVVSGASNSNDLNPTRTFGTPNGSELFVSMISPIWKRTATTILAGCQPYFGLDVDAEGRVLLAGYTSNSTVPPTAGAFQYVSSDPLSGFVARLSANLNTLTYFSFLGGQFGEYLYDVKAGASNDAHVIGYTMSQDFPTTAGAFDKTVSGEEGVFSHVKFTQNQLSIDPVVFAYTDVSVDVTFRIPAPVASNTTIALSGGGGILQLPASATIVGGNTSTTISVPLSFDATDGGKVVRFTAKRGTFSVQQVVFVPHTP